MQLRKVNAGAQFLGNFSVNNVEKSISIGLYNRYNQLSLYLQRVINIDSVIVYFNEAI